MKNIEQITRGALSYLSKEITPMLPVGKSILLGALAPKIIESNIRNYLGKEWVACTGLVADGQVDVDELYKLVKDSAMNRWPIELFGIRFSEPDLDKLYHCIREA